MRRALREALDVTDIALPSFDDEVKLWGDANPEETVTRLTALGVREIVVKDGDEEVALFSDGVLAGACQLLKSRIFAIRLGREIPSTRATLRGGLSG